MSSEYQDPDLHTTSSDPLLEEAEETEDDPRTPIRKLLDLVCDLDVEKCLHDYKAMMKLKDPTILTQEEEYIRSKKILPSGVGQEMETKYRRERDQYQNERDQLLIEVRELRDKVATLENTLGDTLDREREKIKQEYEEKNKEQIHVSQLEKVLKDKLEQEIEIKSKFKEDTDNLKRQLKEKDKVASKLNGRIDKFKKALEQAHEEKDKLEKEKTDALTSKEMGNKLNDKNPKTTDLSDSNCPTKIAEKYSELFDCEWTDALEHLSEVYTEENAIVELLNCIQAAYSFCKEAAARQMENIKTSLTNLGSRYRDDSSPLLSVDPQTERMLEEIRKSQKMPIETLLKEFQYSRVFKNVYKKVPEYMSKCLELCWLMHMHGPPMALGHPPTDGDVFDSNLYKEYTRTGLTVHYVVWLPLLLQENGALLQKGVCQPHPHKDKSTRQRSKNSTSADDIRKSPHQSEQRGHQTTDTNHPLVAIDELFNNESRSLGATGRTRTTQETPVYTSSYERGSHDYLYGDRGQSSTAGYQRYPASSATTTVTTTANYGTGYNGYPYTKTTISGFSANYGAQPRASESPSSRVKYTEPYTINHKGETYVVFQGKTFPLNTWRELERRFYSPGSSDA